MSKIDHPSSIFCCEFLMRHTNTVKLVTTGKSDNDS